MGMADEMLAPEGWWEEFAGADMSDVVLVSAARENSLRWQERT